MKKHRKLSREGLGQVTEPYFAFVRLSQTVSSFVLRLSGRGKVFWSVNYLLFWWCLSLLKFRNLFL